jgi:hypothetical protein
MRFARPKRFQLIDYTENAIQPRLQRALFTGWTNNKLVYSISAFGTGCTIQPGKEQRWNSRRIGKSLESVNTVSSHRLLAK